MSSSQKKTHTTNIERRKECFFGLIKVSEEGFYDTRYPGDMGYVGKKLTDFYEIKNGKIYERAHLTIELSNGMTEAVLEEYTTNGIHKDFQEISDRLENKIIVGQ